jgi:hypothetical protein
MRSTNATSAPAAPPTSALGSQSSPTLSMARRSTSCSSRSRPTSQSGVITPHALEAAEARSSLRGPTVSSAPRQASQHSRGSGLYKSTVVHRFLLTQDQAATCVLPRHHPSVLHNNPRHRPSTSQFDFSTEQSVLQSLDQLFVASSFLHELDYKCCARRTDKLVLETTTQKQ